MPINSRSTNFASQLGQKARRFMVAGVSTAALFGVISAGVIMFFPQELTKIRDVLSAQAATYKLPASAGPSSAASPDVAFLRSFSRVFSNLAKETRPALIMIIAEKKVTVNQQQIGEDFFFPFIPPEFGGGSPFPRGRRQQGIETDAGSGFFVDLSNGYAITNNHVIDGAEKISVTTFDNHKYNAKVVGTAKNLDIAVLKLIDFKPNASLKQLSLADSDKVEVGDWVVALGAPFELPQTLTMGVVSAVKRSGDVLGLNGPNSFIQTDAPINPGNSGGPLVGIDGQAVGMNTAIFSKNGTSVGIGFAIPSNTIRLVADSLINNGKVTQAYLGIELYDVTKLGAKALKEMKIDSNIEGGLVMRVLPGSPAAKAGLRPYDIIHTINGAVVHSPSEIQSQIMFLKPGTSIKLGILRNNQQKMLIANVAEAPTHTFDKSEKNQSQSPRLESELRMKYGILLSSDKPKNGQGVQIERVEANSLAEMAGLQSGDVILQINKKDVSSLGDVSKLLDDTKKSGSGALFLLVERDGNQSAIILQVQ